MVIRGGLRLTCDRPASYLAVGFSFRSLKQRKHGSNNSGLSSPDRERRSYDHSCQGISTPRDAARLSNFVRMLEADPQDLSSVTDAPSSLLSWQRGRHIGADRVPMV